MGSSASRTKGADDGYYLNHSCGSTLGFKGAFTLVARRAITPGDEVTLDYASPRS
jgi:hypothetical protein